MPFDLQSGALLVCVRAGSLARTRKKTTPPAEFWFVLTPPISQWLGRLVDQSTLSCSPSLPPPARNTQTERWAASAAGGGGGGLP